MIVGFDFGVNHFRVAIDAGISGAVAIADRQRREQFETPTLLAFTTTGLLVGDSAQECSLISPQQTLYQPFEAGAVHEDGQLWPPVALAAALVKKALRDVQARSETPIHAVGVSGSDTGEHLAIWQDAMRLNGLATVDAVDAPLAIAHHYAAVDSNSIICEVNVHGWRVSRVRGATGQPEILGQHQGAESWHAIVADYAQRLMAAARHTGQSCPETAATTRLFQSAAERSLGRSLAGRSHPSGVLLSSGLWEFALSPEMLAGMIDPCLRAILHSVAVLDAEPATILLAGDAVERLPVAAALSERFPRSTIRCDRPTFATVFGVLRAVTQQHLRLPYTVGLHVRTERGLTVEPLLTAHTPLPATITRRFFITRADQKRLVLDFVIQKPDGIEPFGRYECPVRVSDKNRPIEVTLHMTHPNTLTVHAVELETGTRSTQTLTRKSAPTGEPFQEWASRFAKLTVSG